MNAGREPQRTVRVPTDETVQSYVQLIEKSFGMKKEEAEEAEAEAEDGEEGAAVSLQCRHCSKAFCNTVALTNHIKLQHESLLASGEAEIPPPDAPPPSLTLNEQLKRMSGAGNFRFVPRSLPASDPIHQVEAKSLVSLVSEDVSYIIIKTEGESPETEPAKRVRRSEGRSEARREPTRAGRPPVELNGPFECLQPSSYQPQGVCHQMFFNCCEYSMHYREEHTKRRKAALRCQVCEKRLDGCLAERASGARAFVCTLCGIAFPDSSALEDHARTLHTKAKPFQCGVCLKRFTQQGGLQQHMRMHTGDRPFPCTYCEKAFTQKAGLEQHLRTHTKIKPFRCVVCDKSFSQSVHLRQHMRTHTNIQPFECGACGRRFKQSSHLNFHLKSHQSDSRHQQAYGSDGSPPPDEPPDGVDVDALTMEPHEVILDHEGDSVLALADE